MSDVRGIVSHLVALSKDPRNRAAIVKDQGCLPGLVLFLDNDDQCVVELAVQALSYLAACETNQPTMLRELGLVVSLKAIAENSAHPATVREMASEVVQRLAPRKDTAFSGPAATPGPRWAPAAPVVLRKPMAEMQAAPPSDAPSGTAGTSFFAGNVNKSARTLTLQVLGLDDATRRKQAEDALLTVKGVVSFTFDMAVARVAVRARNEVAPETLCAAIGATNVMVAQQVVKNEHGQDVLLAPFGKSPSCGAGSTATPKYLDDEEAPVMDNKQTLARPGDAGSLGGWLSKGLGFISKSLYW